MLKQDMDPAELARGYKMVEEYGDADMGYSEMFNLMCCNGISEQVADWVCGDFGREAPQH